MTHPVLPSAAIRLQKLLSAAGVASRRAAETLIVAGRVSVNGVIVRELGTRADPAIDDVRVDGVRLDPQHRRYLLLNKPRGYVTTRSDPQGRPTVLSLLPGVAQYLYPAGRLDVDTEGLLIITNDGELTAALTHPRHGVIKVYEAYVVGVPPDSAIERLRRGVVLDGRRTAPADVRVQRPSRSGDRDATVLTIGLREGRYRQVRRMCEAVGHPVRRLRRVRIGPVSDATLRVGQWRDLTPSEVRALWQAAVPTASTPVLNRVVSEPRPTPRNATAATRRPRQARDRPRRG